jgi:hypothetical protein
VNRGQASREDVIGSLGKLQLNHDSQSATVPVMCIERGTAGPVLAPRRACTRIHGSNGNPSGRTQRV